MSEPGLDAAFLEFIRAPDPEARRRIHGWYVRLFAGCGRVADLACGRGEFVGFLAEEGIEAVGVDGDPANVAAAEEAGYRVVQGDVIEWLRDQPPESLDGIFSAHLVEHLPHGKVAALFHECHRVLAPGGRLVTVTPNVRALYSHLETYYQHFGHVSFYHPLLLRFFAQRAGFERSEEGENPRLASPMFGRLQAPSAQEPVAAAGSVGVAGSVAAAGSVATAPSSSRAASPSSGHRTATSGWDERAGLSAVLRYDPMLPRRGGPLGYLWWRAKMTAVRFLVQPFLDPLVDDLRSVLASTDVELRRLDRRLRGTSRDTERMSAELEAVIDRLDRSYEAYVVSTKADRPEPSGAGPLGTSRAGR